MTLDPFFGRTELSSGTCTNPCEQVSKLSYRWRSVKPTCNLIYLKVDVW